MPGDMSRGMRRRTQVWIDVVEELLHGLGCLTVDFLEETRAGFLKRGYGCSCVSIVYRVRREKGDTGNCLPERLRIMQILRSGFVECHQAVDRLKE